MRLIVIAALAALLLWPRRSSAGPRRVPDDPNVPDPPELPDEPTLPEVVNAWTTDTPTMGRGYQIRQGDTLLGANGIAARALRNAGRPDGAQARLAYYRQVVRERSNWRLYGVLDNVGTVPPVERVTVRSADGEESTGNLGAAFLPRNDPWQNAIAQGDLPRRAVQWNRNANGQIRNNDATMHGPRTYGRLMLPPEGCVDLGQTITDSPACDWPPEMYALAGTTWEGGFA